MSAQVQRSGAKKVAATIAELSLDDRSGYAGAVSVSIEVRGEGDRAFRAIVREGWAALTRGVAEADREMPRHVVREMERYLACGDPAKDIGDGVTDGFLLFLVGRGFGCDASTDQDERLDGCTSRARWVERERQGPYGKVDTDLQVGPGGREAQKHEPVGQHERAVTRADQ